ncbi:MAG: KamA family radical SAM protein, partial [bacterium]|nr:KamA family radical SAM protein [bacterium]
MIDLEKLSKRWKKCWHVAPDIYLLLKESKSIDASRQKIMNYLNGTEAGFRNDYYELSNAEFILFKHALHVLKNIFSKRYERIAGTSPIAYLWKAACNGDSEVKDDFIDEFQHLFRAIKGHTQVYPSHLMEGAVLPDFEKYKGREAAIKRSDFLDVLGNGVDRYIRKYPDGLRPDIHEKRQENKKRILKAFNATEEDWDDYKWHYKNVIRDEKGLEKMMEVVKITEDQEKAIRISIEHKIPFAITPHHLHLMDEEPGNYDQAVRRQVFPPLPYAETMVSHKNDRSLTFDFMREHDTSPCDGITRRYPKVAIFKPVDTCPQICVYCQRNWEITSPDAESLKVSKKTIAKAVKWVADHEQIMDLLITGGDPLIMSNKFIDELLGQLSEIPHLKSIRIASRTIVATPQRVDDELLDIFSKYHDPFKRTIYVVTHFQHPYEICAESAKAVEGLRKRGLSVYNQQVFTFSNSRKFETTALRVALKKIGVDPYYVFNMKGKSEMSDYSVPVARILQERKEEARVLPGIYRSDEPVFNVPFLGKNHLRAWQDHEWISLTPEGERIYAFHPWEKNIRGVDSYIYKDVTIRSYLEKLRERGEDTEEYRSI